MELTQYIDLHYNFLKERGYKIVDINANGGAFYSTAVLENSEKGIKFYFTVEKGIVSTSITSNTVLQNKKLSKYEMSYDFFYLTKYFKPKINYSEITPAHFPEVIKINIDKIEEIFGVGYSDEVFQEIEKIKKNFNKIRWK